MAKKRINVMLPEEVLKDLQEMVPARKRSEFLAEAAAEKVRILKQREAIKKYAGILKEEDYPHWANQAAFEKWRKELWAGTEKRIEERLKEADGAKVPAR